jgi:hypothetical protein
MAVSFGSYGIGAFPYAFGFPDATKRAMTLEVIDRRRAARPNGRL